MLDIRLGAYDLTGQQCLRVILDGEGNFHYKRSMLQLLHEVFADPILMGMLIVAVLINAGALGMKSERRRSTNTSKTSVS